MTRSEAEKFARGCLFNYKNDAARLEQKRLKLQTVRERGSCIGQEYRDRAGRSSARYIDSVPGWLQEVEFLELSIRDLELCVLPIRRLLADTLPEERIVYTLRYERRLSWERAKTEARESHSMGAHLFFATHSRLIDLAIMYLDLPV